MSPQVSALVNGGIVEAQAWDQVDTFEAGVLFARSEGLIPAPESNHAVKAAIHEALACKESGDEKVILFNMSGHGNFDMAAYDRFLRNEMERFDHPEEAIADAMQHLPEVNFPG